MVVIQMMFKTIARMVVMKKAKAWMVVVNKAKAWVGKVAPKTETVIQKAAYLVATLSVKTIYPQTGRLLVKALLAEAN